MEGARRLAAPDLHRRRALEVRIGQKVGAQLLQRGLKRGRVFDVEFAEDEGLRAASLPNQDAALGVEKRRIARLVDEEVQRAGRVWRVHAVLADWKAPGQPPCASITRSISAIRPMVSDSATTTF